MEKGDGLLDFGYVDWLSLWTVYRPARRDDGAYEMLRLPGYREAAAITQQRRSSNLMRTLSRTSSTASLRDVRIEAPPEAEDEGDISHGASTSARLLFGRPPLKSLLRRSGRAAIRESMHLNWATTARAYERNVALAAAAKGKASQLSRLQMVAGELGACT